MKVLLDTNFLLLPLQFGVDIFEELGGYKIIVLKSSINELERLAKRRGRQAGQAKLALQILDSRGVAAIKTGLKGDKAILGYAKRHRCKVATNDKELIKALKSNGIKIIRLRQRKLLVEE